MQTPLGKPRWVYYYREGTGPAYGEKAPDSANENDVDDGGEAPPKKKVKRQPYTTRDMTRVGKEHMKHCGSVQYYSVLCPICNAYVERHFNLPKHLQKHLNQSKSFARLLVNASRTTSHISAGRRGNTRSIVHTLCVMFGYYFKYFNYAVTVLDGSSGSSRALKSCLDNIVASI